MLGYIDPGTATFAGTAVVAAGATVATVAKMGWKNTIGKLSPKQRRLEAEKQAAAEAAEAEETEATEPETADAD